MVSTLEKKQLYVTQGMTTRNTYLNTTKENKLNFWNIAEFTDTEDDMQGHLR